MRIVFLILNYKYFVLIKNVLFVTIFVLMHINGVLMPSVYEFFNNSSIIGTMCQATGHSMTLGGVGLLVDNGRAASDNSLLDTVQKALVGISAIQLGTISSGHSDYTDVLIFGGVLGGAAERVLSGCKNVYNGIRKECNERLFQGVTGLAIGGATFFSALKGGPKLTAITAQGLALSSYFGLLGLDGYRDVKKGKTLKGLLKMALGVVGVSTSAFLTLKAFTDPEQYVEVIDDHPSGLEVQEELSSRPALVKRRIKLATIYRNSGPDRALRDEISSKVTENHRQYALKWGLGHDVVNENLVQNKCVEDGQTVDCSPYFNKIAYLKEQCDNYKPEEGLEDWVFYGDDDLLYTNPNINPFMAIDDLRGSADTSMILAQEGADWVPLYPLPGYKEHDPRVGINSGYIMTRIDKSACDIIQRTWDHRLTAADETSWNYPNCKTVGSCRNQYTLLNDQAAMAMALQDDLDAIGQRVTILLPRDAGSPTRGHIAFNTLHRDGCVTLLKNGKTHGPFDIGEFDRKNYPDGQWRAGDWNGQTAGFPIMGRYPLGRNEKGECVENFNLPTENVRLKKLEEMFDQIPEEQRFTIGMTYTEDGLLDEFRYSHLTAKNHAEYARQNGADFWQATGPIQMECTNLKTKASEQCVPYWRKIYEVQRFVNQPIVPGKADWYVYADEDGFYGNMRLSLSRVIQELQGDSNASILVAKDLSQQVSHTNTGIIFVRKNEESRAFIEKWLEMRNARTWGSAELSLGTSDQRSSLHEQEALNRMLKYDLKSRDIVKVVDIRSPSRDYGVNSYFRDGCFIRSMNSGVDRLDFTSDEASGKAQIGDMYIQTAGVPRTGWYCGESSAVPEKPIRLKYIQQVGREMVLGSKFEPIKV